MIVVPLNIDLAAGKLVAQCIEFHRRILAVGSFRSGKRESGDEVGVLKQQLP